MPDIPDKRGLELPYCFSAVAVGIFYNPAVVWNSFAFTSLRLALLTLCLFASDCRSYSHALEPRAETRRNDLLKRGSLSVLKLPEYGSVFWKQSKTGGVRVWLWQTTVRDYEPLHRH